MKIAIIGSGVIGLSTGILLARNGHDVIIYAKERPPSTVSDVACAIWLPLLVGEPALITEDSLSAYKRWAATSWNAFVGLLGSEYGVRWTRLYKMFPDEEAQPYFAELVRNFKSGYDSKLPPGFTYEWTFDTLIIETSKYMPRLVADFEQLGGKVLTRTFNSVADVVALEESIIFNCSGLGARELVNDAEMYPVKGQLILHAPIELEFSLSAGEYCLIPRSDFLVLGALFETDFQTVQPTDINNQKIWSTIEKWLAHGIDGLDLSRVQLSRAEIRSTISGLRPYRPHGIRLEAEVIQKKLLIHDYGHGGSGITFSWGCAHDALALMQSHIARI